MLLDEWNDGDESALATLIDVVYEELRDIAHRHLREERTGHTLNTTALVHEAYMHLADRTAPEWRGRPQFFALVSKVMRHVLIDYARLRNAEKRGGGASTYRWAKPWRRRNPASSSCSRWTRP